MSRADAEQGKAEYGESEPLIAKKGGQPLQTSWRHQQFVVAVIVAVCLLACGGFAVWWHGRADSSWIQTDAESKSLHGQVPGSALRSVTHAVGGDSAMDAKALQGVIPENTTAKRGDAKTEDMGESSGAPMYMSHVVRHTEYANHAAAMPQSLLVREAAASFLAAPAGTTQNLFIPAVHRCNENLKQHPGYAKRSEKQIILEQLLRKVDDVNAELGLPTILFYGSVLGYYRNCDIIRGDNDVDTALLGHWLQGERSIEKLKAAYARHNLFLWSGMCPNGPQYTGCELRIMHDDLHGINAPGGRVDIFVLATESACDEGPCSFFGSYITAFGQESAPGWPVPSGVFHKSPTGSIHFEQAEFLDRTFWIPAPTLDYLKLNYGETWYDPKGPNDHKSIEWSKDTSSIPDTFGEKMPSSNYVRSLEKTGRMREQ